MKFTRAFRVGALALGIVGAAALAHASGMFSTLPGIGQSSFCASTVTGTGNLGGITGQGQGSTGSICGQTIPAGPPTFAGTEYLPVDIGPLGANDQTGGAKTVSVSLLQLGQGAAIDLTTVGTTQTIPAGVSYYYIDGTQASAFTVTMPAAPVEGQIESIVCESATAGTLTVAGNTGQTMKFNPNAACVAGTTYRYRYTAATATWFKV